MVNVIEVIRLILAILFITTTFMSVIKLLINKISASRESKKIKAEANKKAIEKSDDVIKDIDDIKETKEMKEFLDKGMKWIRLIF